MRDLWHFSLLVVTLAGHAAGECTGVFNASHGVCCTSGCGQSRMACAETPEALLPAALGLIESASYISDMKGTAEEGRYYAFNENRGVAGDIGFDPLGFAAKGDLRGEELIVGRIAMLGIAGMVAQELNTAGYLFYPDTY